MTPQSQSQLQSFFGRAYSDGLAHHGNLNLRAETFADRLYRIAEVHIGAEAPADTGLQFLEGLHTNDLYLSTSCVERSEAAWRRFDICYRVFLRKLATFACKSTDDGVELTDRVMIDMFLPGQSGQPRIGLFDGRVPLAVWLRSIVIHSAIKELKRPCLNAESIESLPEMAGENSRGNVLMGLRAQKYEAIARDALSQASRILTSRERTILLLRYDEQLRAREIARIYAVDPSTITRTIQKACDKLKKEVVSVLSSKHQLGEQTIKECIEYILETPKLSILALLDRAEKAIKASA